MNKKIEVSDTIVGRRTKKRAIAKAKTTKSKNQKQEEINHLLVNNFVALQKALTNLSVKFDNLSEQMSKLLNLFEISAKSFLEKEGRGMGLTKEDREFVEKLDKLFDQNKTIAKALTLMEERARGHSPSSPQSQQNQPPRNMPRF